MSSDEENENEVILPVPDSMSDGDETTWRLNDPQFQYRMIDDTRWRVALAQMWIEKTGAIETGTLIVSLLFPCCLLYVVCIPRLVSRLLKRSKQMLQRACCLAEMIYLAAEDDPCIRICRIFSSASLFGLSFHPNSNASFFLPVVPHLQRDYTKYGCQARPISWKSFPRAMVSSTGPVDLTPRR